MQNLLQYYIEVDTIFSGGGTARHLKNITLEFSEELPQTKSTKLTLRPYQIKEIYINGENAKIGTRYAHLFELSEALDTIQDRHAEINEAKIPSKDEHLNTLYLHYKDISIAISYWPNQ